MDSATFTDAEGVRIEPEIGGVYSNNCEVVEVRAVCASHVVCDGERVYRREEFAREFMTFGVKLPGWAS